MSTATHQMLNVDARALLRLLPHGGQSLLRDVRSEVVRRTDRLHLTDWREAWNTAAQATPGRPGSLAFHAHITCPNCKGKRINMRQGTACYRCMARGRVYEQVKVTALYAPPQEIAQ